ncbi:uncharacterized protein LOC101740315 isoform X2 [Bombyx mori]|uniref:Uncharacterized protein n=2 Tax=Bombyx mori TaxID=7091 RepID=A0A8R2M0V0_BOMMO|nr:extensin-2 isoform X2 [Bombyx mori]
MIPRWRKMMFWCLLLTFVSAEEQPLGLVSKDTEHDLIAEATHSGAQAQKREAGLSNSYGEPLPPDAYGPPRDTSDLNLQLPVPVYGVPQQNDFLQETPPGAYGPPSPVVFPSQHYEGPPPPISKPKPIYGPPKFHGPPKNFGPPKLSYGPPKSYYGPPKKLYGPPKQGLPKPSYGTPFKAPKVLSKPYPKPVYGPPKPVYGPPKPIRSTYGPPLPSVPLEAPPLPQPTITTVETTIGLGGFGSSHAVDVGANFGTFGDSSLNLDLNLPAPIYGTPIVSLPLDVGNENHFPSETYGPPGHALGPIGPNDQVVVQDIADVGHYGPPQPDPNPRPPHPGIPAPPTPPHVLYDGWKPIPGVSKPVGHVEETVFQNVGVSDHYGLPPPPVHEIHVNEQQLPVLDQGPHFAHQISTGYSSVHQDALSNVDLNSLVGGDSNHIDQSKTVFEAHYTENHDPQADLAFIQSSIPSQRPFDSYGAPPLDSLSGGPYPPSVRQQGAKGLIPPSGVYGVPPGSQYGAPPKPPPSNLPIPYGSYSGGGHSIHTGLNTPKKPIKFRDSVPAGLLEHVGQTTHGKDTLTIDNLTQGPAYLPPPIRDAKEVNHHTSFGINLSIEPTDLYSLPHAGNPLNFQAPQPSNLYGSPIDSYSAPFLTVADHTASGSNTNAVTTTIDGALLANLSNLEAAAILKHCPYHEAILKAAQYGEKIPVELATKYMASLKSLGSTLSKNQFTSYQNSEAVHSSRDQLGSAHTAVHSVLPNNVRHDDKVKGKSLREIQKQSHKGQNLQFVSDQIQKTSDKIKSLNEEAKILQQQIVHNNQNLNQGQFSSQATQFSNDFTGNQATYAVQIQSSVGGKGKDPSIPHEQLLNEGLLQSILQAIEQPRDPKQQSVQIRQQPSNTDDGLVLPVGYEPVDRTKEIQSSNRDIKQILHSEIVTRGDVPDCELKADGSVNHEVVVPAPLERVKPVEEVNDNDVAIFFDEKPKNNEPVTEISVATSISEDSDENGSKTRQFGEKIKEA